MTPSFWAGRRVLLTGHTGFKGAWLSLWLAELGAEVTGLALPPDQTPSLFEEAHVGERITSTIGDIRDRAVVEDAFRRARPEIVLHLAAQALVRRSYREPVETYATNVMGTAHVLEAARRSPGLQAVVVVTTDKCYENREWIWPYRESEPLGGHDPYSSSKACAELVVSAYRRSFLAEQGIGVASARAGNVIGGGDWSEDRLLPDLIRAFEEGRPAIVRRPDAVRPWQHVLEPLHGYLLLAERLAGGEKVAEAWNFGPTELGAASVRHVADALVREWGGTAVWRHVPDPGPHEATLLRLDISKARAELGWTPALDLGESLRWTIDWHKRHLAGESAAAASAGQLADYMTRLGQPQ
jgi:CDP-glucose 4,6-dehydratase